MTVAETSNKVDCCHIRSTLLLIRLSLLPKLATNRQQLEFDILLRSTLSPIQSTLLQIQSTLSPVCTGQSNTVDFVNCQHVEFNFVACVYGAKQHGRLCQLSTC